MSMSLFEKAYAAAEAVQEGAKGASQPTLLESLIPFIFVFIVMYFLMIRPQAKKAKEHSKLIESLKPGSEVVTTGGIIGRVKSVADEFVSLDVGSTHLKVVKENIVRLSKSIDRSAKKS